MTPQTPAAQQPIICTSSCRAHHRLSTKGEIFSKYCNITKTQGVGFHQLPPCATVRGVALLVRPRVNGFYSRNSKLVFNVFNLTYQFFFSHKEIV